MASISETGHAKNVANFEDLISFCKAYGITYNPSKEALKIANLTTQLADAQAILASFLFRRGYHSIACDAAMEPRRCMVYKL